MHIKYGKCNYSHTKTDLITMNRLRKIQKNRYTNTWKPYQNKPYSLNNLFRRTKPNFTPRKYNQHKNNHFKNKYRYNQNNNQHNTNHWKSNKPNQYNNNK